MATNKVVYGNTTLIDLTSDTATPSQVIQGATFHDRSGVAQTGTFAPTIITPRNNNPIQLTHGQFYLVIVNDGYAINSYSNKTPDDTNPPSVSNGEIVLMGDAGYLYKTQQGSGVTLNPSQLTAVCVRNTTSTVTIDTTKHYIVTAAMRITGQAVRGGSWYVNEGVVTALAVTSDANANVTISGTTLSLQGTQASYNVEFHVIQLD